MTLTAKQFPYTGPYEAPGSAGPRSKGPTAEALKRAMSRLGYIGWRDFDQIYNQKIADAMADWQISAGISPATGAYGQKSWEHIREARVPLGAPHAGEYALDTVARALVQKEAAGAPPMPPSLIEPKQGWDSLVKDLWPAYSLGRGWGFTDLGTYNPASRLPSGAPSDHATSRLDGRIGEPACAFDLGFSPQTGQANPLAKRFFDEMRSGHWPVHYVILGDKIWSKERGLHRYTFGGHEGHVHTSGYRR